MILIHFNDIKIEISAPSIYFLLLACCYVLIQLMRTEGVNYKIKNVVVILPFMTLFQLCNYFFIHQMDAHSLLKKNQLINSAIVSSLVSPSHRESLTYLTCLRSENCLKKYTQTVKHTLIYFFGYVIFIPAIYVFLRSSMCKVLKKYCDGPKNIFL